MVNAMNCAIMLPTHNRLEDIRRTLSVIARLDPPPDEVLITADACMDGTQDFVRREHAAFRLFENESPCGSTASRNHMMHVAESAIVLSLDDDSHPIEIDAIARVRDLFEHHPRLAVASFPQRTTEYPATLTTADFGAAHFAGTYVNCACAFRREVFVALGGHFEPFWNAYDEADFSARCVSAGWQVRFDPAVTVRHHYSGVNRNELRVHQMHARNELWSVLLRCPAPQLFAVGMFRAARQFGYAMTRGPGWAMREPKWWLAFFKGVARPLRERKALPWQKYKAWMQLVRRPIHAENEWLRRFGNG